jgi:hypothetical protein
MDLVRFSEILSTYWMSPQIYQGKKLYDCEAMMLRNIYAFLEFDF